jgi:hypothetical protein
MKFFEHLKQFNQIVLDENKKLKSMYEQLLKEAKEDNVAIAEEDIEENDMLKNRPHNAHIAEDEKTANEADTSFAECGESEDIIPEDEFMKSEDEATTSEQKKKETETSETESNTEENTETTETEEIVDEDEKWISAENYFESEKKENEVSEAEKTVDEAEE